AKNSRTVFLEASARIAYRPTQLCSNIRLSIDVVDNLTGNRIVKQPIYGEIAPQNILFRICEDHSGRTSAIDVRLVGTKRRNFERMAAVKHKNDSELRTDTSSPRKSIPAR